MAAEILGPGASVSRRGPDPGDDYFPTLKKRFEVAKSAWSQIREDFDRDMRFVNVLGGQWSSDVRTDRENSDKPVLEFNELHTYVQQIANRARKERPQPKVEAGDQGDPKTADLLEDKLRHVQYASQADVAYDNAVECASAGGLGYYRITREWTNSRSFHQEPRVRRILDPKTVYFDPSVQEPDFSDAKWCFVRRKVAREDFEKEFGEPPVQFDSEQDPNWQDDEGIWIAEYWRVETRESELVELRDGSSKFADELEEGESGLIVNRRPVEERSLYIDIVDGNRQRSSDLWPGDWIPIIPVLGREVVVEGRRILISAVRFALDAQKLKNVYKSGIAQLIGEANNSPWIGYAGQFKSDRWRSGKTYRYLEVDPVSVNGQVAPLPTRAYAEPPIQALSQAALTESDDIKRSVGYIDNVLRPSTADLSGVAVERRGEQQELTNFHFQDNLVRSQWHGGRVMLDLLLNLADTPRTWQAMKKDGTTYKANVTREIEGVVPEARGQLGQPHHRIDLGTYDMAINTGPTYATKLDEEKNVLLATLQQNPAAWQLYADIVFRLLGYSDLEERAKLALPPAIQQAITAKDQNVPPQIQQQLVMLTTQNQQLKQGLQQALLKLQTKQVEQEGRLHVERLKTAGNVLVEDMRQRHDATKELASDHMEAVQILLQLLQQSEAGPQTQSPAAAAPPQPAQPAA